MTTNQVNEPVSVITAVKNRANPLYYTVPTWLAQPNVKQLIIVDWDSEVAVMDELGNADIPGWPDPRVTVVRVEEQKFWQMGKAINLGMQFVKCSVTLKIDADVAIINNNLPKISNNQNCFFSGQHLKKDIFGRNSLFGTVMFRTTDFLAVNGFDERFKSYGHEDLDLYNRLISSGKRHLTFAEQLFFHLPHSDRKRQENQECQYRSLAKALRETRKACAKRAAWQQNSSKCEFVVVDKFRDYVILREKLNSK